MPVIERSCQVPLTLRVYFSADIFARDNHLLASILEPAVEDAPGHLTARVLVVVEERLVAAFPTVIHDITAWFAGHPQHHLAADPIVVPGGEAAKCEDRGGGMPLVLDLARRCREARICRHSYLLILGGGALLDAAGLAGSLVHRGVRQVRLPTTTLAQADAGLGVKNAVNAFGDKNFLGTFSVPWAVVNDVTFLSGQDDRSWRAGIAEAIKVAIITDRDLLFLVDSLAERIKGRDLAALSQVIERCALAHITHITTAGDPFETGSSRPLDFGHWSAHHLEALSSHRIQHGEAVAIGLAIDVGYATAKGWIPAADALFITDLLRRLGFVVWSPLLDLRDDAGRRIIYRGLDRFREHLGGRLTLAMPDGCGRRQEVNGLDEAVCDQVIADLAAYG